MAAAAQQRLARVGRLAALAGALVGTLLVTLATACSAAPPGPDASLPASFRIEDLRISLSRQNGNAAYAPRVVTLNGVAAASLMRDGKSVPFPFPAADRLALLNELFKIRFFDLPSQYSTRAVAQLMGNGSVGLQELHLSNANVNSVCVAVAGFEKCVRYGTEAPMELDLLAKRVMAEAERLAEQH